MQPNASRAETSQRRDRRRDLAQRNHLRPRRINCGQGRRPHHLLLPVPGHPGVGGPVHRMTVRPTVDRQAPAVALIKTVAYVQGSVLVFIALAMLAAAGVSVFYAEFGTALAIAVAAGVTAAFGYGTRRLVARPATITVKQGFATVGLAWFVFSLFGALPFLISGAIPDI